MNNIYKSPTKNHSKSVISLPRSHNKLINSPKTPSKTHSQIKREIFNSQVYKTILTKLLSKNKIEQFLHEAFKFTIINDEFSLPYINKQYLTQSSSKDFPQLGKSFLRDGSFLKHYCSLLILKEPNQKYVIRKRFYQRYKEEVIEKKAYFQRFFKVQIKLQQDQVLQVKLQTSRKNIEYSLKKSALSLKKAVTEKIQLSQKYDQRLQSISAVDPKQSKQTTITAQIDHSIDSFKTKQPSHLKIIKSIKQKQVKTPDKYSHQLDNQELTYVSCRSKNKKYLNETEEERQKRLLGLVTSRSKNIQRKDTNIIKFQDSIQANKRLIEKFQSMKKNKQLRTPESNNKSNNKTELQLSPINKQTYRRLKTYYEPKQLKKLTTQLIQKITSQEKSLLQFFPNITRIGFRDRVQKDIPITLGSYRYKKLMKSYIIDYHNCIQPTLIAVYLEPLSAKEDHYLSSFKRQIDRSVEVLLVDQFCGQNQQNNTK